VDRRRVDWTYDALGRRVRQVRYVLTNSTWQVVEDLKLVSDPELFGRHIAELNGTNGAVVRSYVWGLDLSGSLDGAGGVGGLLWVRLSGGAAAGLHFVTYDGNGNVWNLVSAGTGTETARYEYGPFGEPLRMTGAAAGVNPFRFSTKRTEDGTGLVLYEYRAYSPSLGHWLSRDKINEKGGINLYGYTANQPIAAIDFLGLDYYIVQTEGACGVKHRVLVGEINRTNSYMIHFAPNTERILSLRRICGEGKYSYGGVYNRPARDLAAELGPVEKHVKTTPEEDERMHNAAKALDGVKRTYCILIHDCRSIERDCKKEAELQSKAEEQANVENEVTQSR
ncbi:RHS repeat-associated core domain-containing protein, partial [Limisphaera ngatamarikiensis]|uniref:RHS repeat-associated core domain-containing protein n=1 Tax=Limisphaera ngatamarikiensis TaxID=1324935 RepID=UPI00197CE47E